LATSILSRFGTDVEALVLKPSSGGVYEIRKNDDMIFSKKEVGRFPESEAEIIDKL